MLNRVGRFVVRRRRLILVVGVIVFAASGALGGGVAQKLSTGGFDGKASESAKADRVPLDHFKGAGTPNLVLVVSADPRTTVDNPSVRAPGHGPTPGCGEKARE